MEAIIITTLHHRGNDRGRPSFISESAAFTAALVRETGVALAPGVAFGRDGEGYIRVCFASTEATVGDALERLRIFVMNRGAK